MSNINLLPWRDAVRAGQKKQFLIWLTLACVVTVAVMLAVNSWVHQQIARQQERNQLLQTETARLDLVLGEIRHIKTQRTQLLERMLLIESFQQRRNLSVRLFNQLPELVPPGVYLSSVNVAGSSIDVVGKTEAYTRVASMIRQIEDSGWLTEPRVSSIFASDTRPIALSQFSMLFRIADATAGVTR
ncbi:fimbrial assembly protein [Zobellella denitrificans]|jgi:type IV pilus assembly protein PilN|uniref:PilN domain-containing protein n=1 Tax=Zobellella denitrificans TaxID=347534 RepID=UPI000B8BE98A|nr:PilN domain-containing protein [Zobellella denitrificans]OXS14871.1 fimbrial assembly protein [Zobellella denitrificans]